MWSKVPILVDALKQYPDAKWIWWLDVDAIIMTPTIDLGEHFLNPDPMFSKLKKEPYKLRGYENDALLDLPKHPDPNNINLLIAGDHNGINAGSFFLRRSDWTNMFLDIWLDPLYRGMDWAGKEQDALIHMMQYHKIIGDHVGILPQRMMNAYSEGDENMRWQPKDLAIHFAGCW